MFPRASKVFFLHYVNAGMDAFMQLPTRRKAFSCRYFSSIAITISVGCCCLLQLELLDARVWHQSLPKSVKKTNEWSSSYFTEGTASR